MKKTNNLQKGFIAVLAFVMVGMSIGFAAYSAKLSVTGTTTVASNKWSVHFDKGGVSHTIAGTAAGENPVVGEDTLTATIAPSLAKPGDKYTATIPVINDGTFDAQLKAITVTPLSAGQDKYIHYKVYYGSQLIFNNGNPSDKISAPIKLAKSGGKENVIIELEFFQPAEEASLPTGGDTLKISVQLDFDQPK